MIDSDVMTIKQMVKMGNVGDNLICSWASSWNLKNKEAPGNPLRLGKRLLALQDGRNIVGFTTLVLLLTLFFVWYVNPQGMFSVRWRMVNVIVLLVEAVFAVWLTIQIHRIAPTVRRFVDMISFVECVTEIELEFLHQGFPHSLGIGLITSALVTEVGALIRLQRSSTPSDYRKRHQKIRQLRYDLNCCLLCRYTFEEISHIAAAGIQVYV